MSGKALSLLSIFAAAVFSADRSQAVDLVLYESGLTGGKKPEFIEEEHGEITVPSGIGLVSNGAYSGTGTLTEASLPGQRMHVAIGETQGTLSADGGSTANPFAAFSRRKTVHVSGAPWQGAGGRYGSTSPSFSSSTISTAEKTS